jgi:hypothetical protein
MAPTTSLGQCAPRYTRDTATRITNSAATTRATTRAVAGDEAVSRNAPSPKMITASMACPDGKLNQPASVSFGEMPTGR